MQMEDSLKKMMQIVSKKKGSKMLSDDEKTASLSVLEDLVKSMEDDQLDGMYQVKISSNSPEGLKKGAQIVEKKMDAAKGGEISEEMGEDEEMDEECCEEDEEYSGKPDIAGELEDRVEDFSDLSEEEIQDQIERLQKMKEKKKLSSIF